MKSPDPVATNPTFKNEAPSLPPAKWWGGFVVAGNPPQRRFVFRWKRISAVVVAFILVCYLGLTTALWGYYSLYRKIPGVNWVDVTVLPRFSRVQAAIGDYYYNQAKPLAESILSEMTTQLGTQNDKVRQGSLALVRPTASVSVLIEVAYMINPDDYTLLTDKDFQAKCAKSIADGVEKYLLN